MNKWHMIPFWLTSVLTVVTLTFSYRYFSGNNKKIFIKDWIIIIIISILMVKNNLRQDFFLKSSVLLLLNISLYYAIFRDTFFSLIHLSLYICIISVFTDFIFSILISGIVSDINYFNNNMFFTKIFFSIAICLIFYFICRLPIFKKIYNKMIFTIQNKKNFIIILYLIFGIIATLYSIYIFSGNNLSIYISILLLMIFIYYISSLYLKEMYINSLLKVKNSYLLDSQILFKRNMEDYRLLKHNLLNDIIFIKTLCSKEIQEIINEKMIKYEVMPDILSNINNIPEGLQGIIYLKSSIAKNLNINFYIDNLSNFDHKKLNNRLYIDLCEVLGILLDNAIEACTYTKAKVVYLNINEDKNNIFIEIINTFSNDINLDKIGNKYYSTKGQNNGLGLNYIYNLNKKIIVKKEIIHDLFKILILIKK